MKDEFVGTSFRREWPLIALAIASVFEYRFGKSPSITLLEIVSFAVMLQIFLDKIALGSRIDWQLTKGLRMVAPALPFFVWALLCGFLALSVRENPLNLWQFRDLFPSLMIFITLAAYGANRESLKRLLVFYFFAAMVIGLVGALQTFTGWPQIVEYNIAVDAKMDVDGRIIVDTRKSTGFSTHPNEFASFLIFPFAILFTRLRLKNSSIPLLFLLLFAGALFLVSLKGTYAKGGWAWVALVAALIILSPKPLMRLSWLPSLSVAVFAMALLSGSLYLFEHGYHSFVTMLTRVRLWQAAWAIAERDWYVWFFGNGQYAMPWTSWRFSDIAYPNAHSSLVNLPLIYGLPGAMCFVVMWISAYRAASMALKDSSLNIFAWMLLVAISALFWNALFEPHLEGGRSFAQFSLCLALCFALPGLISAPKMERIYR